VKDECGTTVSNVRDKVEMNLTGATAAELARRPIEYDTGMTLLPGQYRLTLLARDAETGRMGTYERAFIVPNLAKKTQRLPISSVVLSSQRVDMREAIFNASKDKTQVVNSLLWEGKKMIPSVTRVFPTSKNLFVYFQAYGEEAVPAYVTFFSNGKKRWRRHRGWWQMAERTGRRCGRFVSKFRSELYCQSNTCAKGRSWRPKEPRPCFGRPLWSLLRKLKDRG